MLILIMFGTIEDLCQLFKCIPLSVQGFKVSSHEIAEDYYLSIHVDRVKEIYSELYYLYIFLCTKTWITMVKLSCHRSVAVGDTSAPSPCMGAA